MFPGLGDRPHPHARLARQLQRRRDVHEPPGELRVSRHGGAGHLGGMPTCGAGQRGA